MSSGRLLALLGVTVGAVIVGKSYWNNHANTTSSAKQPLSAATPAPTGLMANEKLPSSSNATRSTSPTANIKGRVQANSYNSSDNNMNSNPKNRDVWQKAEDRFMAADRPKPQS